MKKFFATFLIFSLLTTLLNGCFRKDQPKKVSKNTIELTYYKLFDDEDTIKPLIQEFQSQHKNIKINYKKFTNVRDYEDMIINELAEGEGPDIFEIHNTWLPRHYKKIAPLPTKLMSIAQFKDTFVDTTATDLIRYDLKSETEQIFALPLYVDTLALYYNHQIYEEKVPSRGKPPPTWAEFDDDVYKINVPDKSFERFKISAVAMGRSDNILRAIDIFYLLLLQNRTEFYDEKFQKALFASSQGVDDTGKKRNPARESLEYFISFATSNLKNYSWNQYLADKNSPEKELIPFTKGKTAMIFGYSYLYQDIINQIKALSNKGALSISEKDIGIAAVPQVFPEKKRAYASYFAETVARTSAHPYEAWLFLKFLTNKENQIEYNKVTNRPTSRRDLIDEQKRDPIYGIFASQLGHARSLPEYDNRLYKEIFENTISSLNTGSVKPEQALKTAENEINEIIPATGLIPTKPAK